MSKDPSLTSILSGRGNFMETDAPLPKAMFDGSGFSKYFEIEGKNLEFSKEEGTKYYFSEVALDTDDGNSVNFKIRFYPEMAQFSLYTLDESGALAIFSPRTAISQNPDAVSSNENCPIFSGDTIYIGTRKFEFKQITVPKSNFRTIQIKEIK